MRIAKPAAAAVVVAALGLTACGGGGQDGGESGDAAAAGPGNVENIAHAADVYEQFNSMSGDERWDALVNAAQEEGEVTIYSTLTPESAPMVAQAFEEEFGITVELPRMSSEDVITKVTTEQSGKNADGADVLELNGFELTALADQGNFVDFVGPERDAVIEEGQRDGWTADRLNQFVVTRNTDVIPDADWPDRIEDFTDPKYKGKLSMEINEIDWFMTLYDYYTQEKGMSEDEAIDLFKGVATNSVMVDGHATQVDQLASGMFGAAMSTYDYQAHGIAEKGAPLDFDPLVEPVVQRPNGVALVNSAPHPAAGYLFYTWMLTDGQQVLHDVGLRSALKEDSAEGLQDVEVLIVDLEKLKDEFDTYESLYREVVGN